MTKRQEFADLHYINRRASDYLSEGEVIVEVKLYSPHASLPAIKFYLTNKGRCFQGGFSITVPSVTKDLKAFKVWVDKDHDADEYNFRLRECETPWL